MRRVTVFTMIFLLWFSTAVAQVQPWVSAYYAGWMQGYLPPSAIDFGAVTHIIHFSISPSSGPNINGNGNGITPTTSAAIVNAAHAAGKKVLITCGGWGDDAAYVSATNATNRAAFITNLVNFVLANGYDGLDIDWEPITSPAQFKLFIPELRAALDAAKPGLLLTIACMGGDYTTIAAVQDHFDQINIMTYDMSGAWQGWVTWHNSPVYDGGVKFPGTNRFLPSANGDVDSYVAAGIPLGKIGIGADFYGYVWSGVTRPRQSWTTTPSVTGNVPYYELMNTYSAYTAEWDTAAQAAFISVPTGTGKFISLDNEQTMAAKATYVRSKGIGGMIIWELGGGYRANAPAGQRDRLLQAVKAAFFGGTPPPPSDTTRPVIAIVVPQNGSTLSGITTVSATATDNVGVVGVQLQIDGVSAGAELSAAPFTLAINTWQYANGQHTLTATARDFAGNRASASVQVVVQNQGTPPSSPDLVVYDDALRTPFRDASWSAIPDYQNASPVHAGTRSVKVSFSAWGGFDILSGRWNAEVSIDVAKYDTLRFSIYPTAAATFTVGFYVGATTEITPPANTWTPYVIPLPREAFNRFYFMSESSTAKTAYFDAIRFTGGVAKVSDAASEVELPLGFALAQNYPNPFNPSTVITYQLPLAGRVRLAVYDLLGREVAVLVNEMQLQGNHAVQFDAHLPGMAAGRAGGVSGGLSSGTYLYRLESGGRTLTRRMVFVQ